MQHRTAPRPSPAHRTLLICLLILAMVMAASASSHGPRAHTDAACNGCHGAARAAFTAPSVGATAPAVGDRDRQCRRCHGADAHRTNSFGAHATSRGNACTGCHRFHEPGVIATAAGDVDLAAFRAGADAHCRSCHAPGRSLQALEGGHREAARLYHAAGADLGDVSPSAACLRCHDRESSSDWRASGGGGPSFDDHRSHPVGVAVTPGSGDAAVSIRWSPDPRLALFDGKLECQTCHQLAAPTRHLLVAFDTPKGLCLGCHEFKRGADSTRDATLVVTTDDR